LIKGKKESTIAYPQGLQYTFSSFSLEKEKVIAVFSELDKTLVKHGITIVGQSNLPSTLAQNASELYAKNIYNLLMHLSSKDGMKWEFEEEITKGTLITHQGKIIHPSLISAIA
jgi:alanine dehydrogenase